MNFLYESIRRIFVKKQPEEVKRNVFGKNGDLEMIEYARMIAFIRTHYQKQSKDVGHLDLDVMMVQLSNMTYVEVKALFAAIMEIQFQSMDTYHLEEKDKEYTQSQI